MKRSKSSAKPWAICAAALRSRARREMCKRADRFAAAVLMQRDTFAVSARRRGFDVIALHEEFGRSFASVTMRLAEVLDDPPLAAVLYENRLRALLRGRPVGESHPTVA